MNHSQNILMTWKYPDLAYIGKVTYFKKNEFLYVFIFDKNSMKINELKKTYKIKIAHMPKRKRDIKEKI